MGTGVLIGGQWLPAASGRTFTVDDPATEEVIAEVADAGAEDAIAGIGFPDGGTVFVGLANATPRSIKSALEH